VFPGYNDVRVPGDSGTKLSLTEDLSADSFPAFRARYTVTLAGKHDLGLLAAFLTMRSDGTLDRDVDFRRGLHLLALPLRRGGDCHDILVLLLIVQRSTERRSV